MLIAWALGLAIAVTLYVVLQVVANSVINNVYMSSENKEAREKYYVARLQQYIYDNGLTEDDTVAFARWAQSNKYVYLMVYNGDQLFFDSSMYEELLKPPVVKPLPDDDESGDTDADLDGDGIPDGEATGPDTDLAYPENPDGNGDTDITDPDTPSGGDGESTSPDGEGSEGSGNGEDASGEGTEPGTDGGEGENTEGEAGSDTESGADSEVGENGGGAGPGIIGGITVRFPTRDELKKYAEENDAHLVNTVNDKALVVNMADFTEYLYYDIINIAAIVIATIALFIVIMIHYHGITSRITALAGDVRTVSLGDMEHKISYRGRDEIGELAVNVDDMRTSILENIETERSIMEANAELITSISHDIRTPLTVLLGYLEIMKGRVENDTALSEYVEASEKTALRLKKLSDDLFNYFLLFGAGAKEPEIDEYEIGTLFDQMLSEYVLLLREGGYTVEFIMPEVMGKIRIKTDPADLVRIFENLCSNIMKYADKSHPVSIISEVGGGKVSLIIKNLILRGHFAESNGIGLKTCHKLAERIGAQLMTKEDGEFFTATLILDTEEN